MATTSSIIADKKSDSGNGPKQDTAEAKIIRLQQTLRDLEAERKQKSKQALESSSQADGRLDDIETRALKLAKQTNQSHIKLLTRYNEIKDAASGLIGMIAENRGKRIIDVMEEFGVDEKDCT